MGGKGSGGNRRLPDEKRMEVFQDLKAGRGVNETANRNGVAASTVARIREANADDLPAWKRKTAHAMMQTAARLVDKVADDVERGDGNIQQKSISLGILLDKAGQLRAEPTQIVEHRLEVGQSLGGWLEERTENTAPNRTIDAEVVEIQEKTDVGSCFGNSDPEKSGPETPHGGEGVEKAPPPSS